MATQENIDPNPNALTSTCESPYMVKTFQFHQVACPKPEPSVDELTSLPNFDSF